MGEDASWFVCLFSLLGRGWVWDSRFFFFFFLNGERFAGTI
jgi:hypothetical protein